MEMPFVPDYILQFDETHVNNKKFLEDVTVCQHQQSENEEVQAPQEDVCTDMDSKNWLWEQVKLILKPNQLTGGQQVQVPQKNVCANTDLSWLLEQPEWAYNTNEQAEQKQVQIPQENVCANKDSELSGEKRKRTFYTSQQIDRLEQEYKVTNSFIEKDRRLILAQELKVKEDKVKIWFQNRRRKERRRKIVGSKKQKKESKEKVADGSTSTTNFWPNHVPYLQGGSQIIPSPSTSNESSGSNQYSYSPISDSGSNSAGSPKQPLNYDYVNRSLGVMSQCIVSQPHVNHNQDLKMVPQTSISYDNTYFAQLPQMPVYNENYNAYCHSNFENSYQNYQYIDYQGQNFGDCLNQNFCGDVQPNSEINSDFYETFQDLEHVSHGTNSLVNSFVPYLG